MCGRGTGRPFEVAAFPFVHRCTLIAGDHATGADLADAYTAMMRALNLFAPPTPATASDAVDVAPPSYNLLLTSRWMLVVPRSASDNGPVSVNSLGYAGTFLVKSAEALAHLRAVGPWKLLATVGIPRL